MKTSGQPIFSSSEGICVAYASKIISSKWTPMLLYALGSGDKRFGELQTTVGGVNPRTLSARLAALERDGIITKTVYAEMPPRVEYALTPKGWGLLPLIKGMISWSEKYAN